MIKSLHHINIVVKDLEDAVSFFVFMGFSVFERKELSGGWIDSVTGLRDVRAKYAGLKHEAVSTAIELLQYINPEGDPSPFISQPNSPGIRHFAFQVENIESTVEKLKNRGTEFLGVLQTNPYGKKMIYLKGPDGIIVELAEL